MELLDRMHASFIERVSRNDRDDIFKSLDKIKVLRRQFLHQPVEMRGGSD
jgi:hypothetical protein